jgi:hypothetical protein
VDDLDTVRQLEDAGAAAIVMHSLFEEQITREELGLVHDVFVHEDSSAEALSYFPSRKIMPCIRSAISNSSAGSRRRSGCRSSAHSTARRTRAGCTTLNRFRTPAPTPLN